MYEIQLRAEYDGSPEEYEVEKRAAEEAAYRREREIRRELAARSQRRERGVK